MMEYITKNDIDVLIMLSTYNGEKFLNQQLESISNQDYIGNIVLYVRDDGSTDSTLEILKAWEDKIRIIYFYDEKKLGAAMSFWKILLDAPKSKYYAFVDQDDVWDKNKLSTAIEALSKRKNRALWFSNYRLIDKCGNIITDSFNSIPPILTVSSQLICGIAQGCSMVFNYELFQYCKSKNIKFIPMHDTVVFSYALAAGEVIYDNKPLFSYRAHENNVVERTGKSVTKKIKSTYNLWFKKRKEISRFAAQILIDNINDLQEKEIEFLKLLSKSNKSIIDRIRIINSDNIKSTYTRGMKSFKIRTLLGLI